MNKVWQFLCIGQPQDLHSLRRLAAGRRLVFERRFWYRMQDALLSLLSSRQSNPRCAGIAHVVRPHRRLETRHLPHRALSQYIRPEAGCQSVAQAAAAEALEAGKAQLSPLAAREGFGP